MTIAAANARTRALIRIESLLEADEWHLLGGATKSSVIHRSFSIQRLTGSR